MKSKCCAAEIVRAPDLDGWMCAHCYKSQTPTGAQMIAAERWQQITELGWTPEHDDGHDGNELARAAVALCKHAYSRGWQCDNSTIPDGSDRYTQEPPPDEWPEDWADWWKPKTPIRDLVKAGALIAAEIDRRNRKASAKPSNILAEPSPANDARKTN